MKVDGKHMRTIWLEPDGWSVGTIDQTLLPYRFATLRLTTLADVAARSRRIAARSLVRKQTAKHSKERT